MKASNQLWWSRIGAFALIGPLLMGGTGILTGTAHAEATCGPATVTTAMPLRTPLLDWSENLGYDAQGDLWVSRILRDKVERFDPRGNVLGSVAVHSPGAVRLGPDGLMYVVSGDSPLNLLPGPATGTVLRFDPAADNPVAQVFATGLGMPNGLGLDAAGNVYVADSRLGLRRFHPDGALDADWTARAPQNLDLAGGVDGMEFNGLAVVGDSIYTTLSSSVTGRVLRVPIDAPHSFEVTADMSSAGTLMPDDLVAAGGALYVTTTLGRVVRVDPVSHGVCTVYSGEPVTAVAVDPAAPSDLLAGTESGDVLRLRLNG